MMIARASLLDLVEAEAVIPTMASPSWWGADSVRRRGRFDNFPVFVKEYAPHATEYLDRPVAVSAAIAAGRAGVAPRVVAAASDASALMFEDLTSTHATATLRDFVDDSSYEALFALRAAVGEARPEQSRWSTVFDDIRVLQLRLDSSNVPFPEDAALLFRVLAEAEERIRATGFDTSFRHGDGNVSNLLRRRDDGSLTLVDWDWAGLIDPFQDLGTAIVELAYDEEHAKLLFEIAHGSYDRALFARTLMYGYADIVRQALIGALVNALDPGTYEYSKFSDWQYLRARSALSTARADELLRCISA